MQLKVPRFVKNAEIKHAVMNALFAKRIIVRGVRSYRIKQVNSKSNPELKPFRIPEGL